MSLRHSWKSYHWLQLQVIPNTNKWPWFSNIKSNVFQPVLCSRPKIKYQRSYNTSKAETWCRDKLCFHILSGLWACFLQNRRQITSCNTDCRFKGTYVQNSIIPPLPCLHMEYKMVSFKSRKNALTSCWSMTCLLTIELPPSNLAIELKAHVCQPAYSALLRILVHYSSKISKAHQQI